MKLIELMNYLNSTESLDELIKEQGLDTDSEALLIYMQDDLSLTAEVSILEIEETDDELFFEKEGVRYIQLYPLEHTLNLIEFDLNMKDKGFSNLEIAQRLLEYRKYDA
jgi:hypothetical protein